MGFLSESKVNQDFSVPLRRSQRHVCIKQSIQSLYYKPEEGGIHSNSSFETLGKHQLLSLWKDLLFPLRILRNHERMYSKALRFFGFFPVSFSKFKCAPQVSSIIALWHYYLMECHIYKSTLNSWVKWIFYLSGKQLPLILQFTELLQTLVSVIHFGCFITSTDTLQIVLFLVSGYLCHFLCN